MMTAIIASLAMCSTPAESVQAAVADMETIPAAFRPQIRWLACESREEVQAVSYLINAVQRTRVILKPQQAGRLLRVDLSAMADRRDANSYKELLAAWEVLAADDPYFGIKTQVVLPGAKAPSTTRVDGGWIDPKRAEILRKGSGSAAAVLRADYFVSRVAGIDYYRWAGVPLTQTELFEGLGINKGAVEKLAADTAANLFKSRVTHKSRRIINFPAPRGYLLMTLDVDSESPDRSAIRNPIDVDGPAGKQRYNFQAAEIFFMRANGFWGFALYDAAGKRQDVVPQQVAIDTHAQDGVVRPGISCIRCHSQAAPGALQPFVDNQFPLLTGQAATLKSYLPEVSQRVAELYDPTLSRFYSTGNMNNRRGWQGQGFGTALLNDGNVLVAGGIDDTNGSSQSGGGVDLNSAELYSPSTESFSYTGSMRSASNKHKAVLLQDGRVLIVGGSSSSEVYDPYSGIFSSVGAVFYRRLNHTATLLPNGKVLITGGYTASGSLSTAELFEPVSGTFSQTGNMKSGRDNHLATLLPSGKVLITGGRSAATNEILDTAEIYDPGTEVFLVIGKMNSPRTGHIATLLLNGKVLIAGGYGGPGYDATQRCESYDPVSGQFTLGNSVITPRDEPLAILLADGSVLIIGGGIRASELYIPSPPSDSTPPSNPSVIINSGAVKTTSRNVTLTLSATDNVGIFGYYASESPTAPLSVLSTWMPIASGTNYSGSVPFTLSPGAGSKTIYVWFKDVAGNMSAVVSASITLE